MVICSLKSRPSIVTTLEMLPRNTFSTPVRDFFFFARCFHVCGVDWRCPMGRRKTASLELGLFLAQMSAPVDLDKLEEIRRKPQL